MADSFTRALSDAGVRNAKPKAKPYKLADGGGLYLLVQPNGARLWRYKFRLAGREGLEALGAYPEVSLADAREAHRASRALVAAGIHPTQARQAAERQAQQERLQRELGCWDRVVDSWRAATDPGLARGTLEQRTRELAKYLAPEFRGRGVDTIKRAELAAVIKRVEARAPEVARNLRAYLWGIFEHAIHLGLLEANPVPPVRMMTPRQPQHRAMLPAAHLGAFLRAVRGCSAEPATRVAMLLVVLTSARKAEVTAARWAEFDLDAATWTVPAARMKGRREHWVPLSRQAVAILRELRQHATGDVVFPHRTRRGQPMAERTLNMLMKRLGYTDATVHGFRSLFSTRYNAQGVAPDVVERCLAHAPRDKVRAAYNRHEYQAERRALLQDWADWLDRLEAGDERQGLRLVA